MDLLINLRDLTGSNLSAALLGSLILNLSFYVLIRVSKAIYRIFQFELFAATSKNLSITKIQFIREIVNWCVENLGLGRNTSPPTIQLLYYKNANYNGIYYSFGKQIIIYWNNHATLLEIIETTIHEYQHFLDLKNNKDSKAYDKESKEVGYYDNYFEIRARETAAKHREACYKYLKKKNIIR